MLDALILILPIILPLLVGWAVVRAKILSRADSHVLSIFFSPVLAIVMAMVVGLSPIFAIALVLSFGIPTAQMVVALCEEEEVEYTKPAAAIVTTTTVALAIIS